MNETTLVFSNPDHMLKMRRQKSLIYMLIRCDEAFFFQKHQIKKSVWPQFSNDDPMSKMRQIFDLYICWFKVGVCRNMTNGDGHVKMLSCGLPCVFQICLSQLFEISKLTDWGSDQQQCVFQICLSFTVLWTTLIDQLIERDIYD